MYMILDSIPKLEEILFLEEIIRSKKGIEV